MSIMTYHLYILPVKCHTTKYYTKQRTRFGTTVDSPRVTLQLVFISFSVYWCEVIALSHLNTNSHDSKTTKWEKNSPCHCLNQHYCPRVAPKTTIDKQRSYRLRSEVLYICRKCVRMLLLSTFAEPHFHTNLRFQLRFTKPVRLLSANACLLGDIFLGTFCPW